MINYNKEKLTIDLSDAINISDLGIKITSVLEENGAVNKALNLKLGKIDLKQSQLLSIKALIEAMQSSLEVIETESEVTETSAIGLGLSVGKIADNNQPFNNDYSPNVDKSFEEKLTSSDELSSFAQLKKLNSLGDVVSDTKDLPEVESKNLAEETTEFLDAAAEEENTSEEKELTKGERVANIYDSLDKEMTHEDIQDALDITFGPSIDLDAKKTEDNVSPVVESASESETDNNFINENAFSDIKSDIQQENKEISETVEKTEESKYVLLDTEGITPEGLELIKANTSDLDTLYLTQTLRSGQTVSYEGNIFLIGDAHPGSEINATGDITVWGILGGIVHAGTKGNTGAKVRALKLNPIQLRIANLYSRRNDTVNVPYVQKSNEFTPEEARIENEQIVIYKTLRRED